jgi:DNA-directed RNA polymerase specialized sigma24 family protein
MALAASDAPLDSSATTSDELAAALDALQELPTPEREMLLLNVARGWSHQRIAEYQHVPLGTVKSTLRRALSRIRDIAIRKGLRSAETDPSAASSQAPLPEAQGQSGGAS